MEDASCSGIVGDASISGNGIDEGVVSEVPDSAEPVPDMVVDDVIEAFVLYSNYARRKGFEIRFRSSESKRRGADDEVEGHRKGMRRGIGCSWFYSDYSTCSRIRLQCVKGELPRPNRRDPKRASDPRLANVSPVSPSLTVVIVAGHSG